MSQIRTPRHLLSATQVRLLKKLAHALKPVVQIGKNGISQAQVAEISSALLAHELIKIQFLPPAKTLMDQAIVEITQATQSHFIGTRGNIVTFFKQRLEKSAFDLDNEPS